MMDFDTANTAVKNHLQDYAVRIGLTEDDIKFGEWGKSAQGKCPFIMVYTSISKPEGYENNTYKALASWGFAIGSAEGKTTEEHQTDSIKMLGRLILSLENLAIKFNIEGIDTMECNSLMAVQLLIISTPITLACEFIPEPEA